MSIRSIKKVIKTKRRIKEGHLGSFSLKSSLLSCSTKKQKTGLPLSFFPKSYHKLNLLMLW
ncbi:hypothetical protein B7P33_17440 [Sediminicola luteus]|uniref:Uncharacterized protein n=1 Tax=Sediminicola luteus TaxID=319238 RepID=A0A2A4G4Z3_9FLAO|nr:hypothetical protein B7P33_17440 [Sediminicola luteus]